MSTASKIVDTLLEGEMDDFIRQAIPEPWIEMYHRYNASNKIHYSSPDAWDAAIGPVVGHDSYLCNRLALAVGNVTLHGLDLNLAHDVIIDDLTSNGVCGYNAQAILKCLDAIIRDNKK